jgi:hypothetical protein
MTRFSAQPQPRWSRLSSSDAVPDALDDVQGEADNLDILQPLANLARWVSVADDIDGLLAWAERQGFVVEVDENGYRRIFTSIGTYIGRYPASPSRKYRRYTEIVIALKKYGLIWPPPSKKEQRSQRRKESS